MMAPAPAVAIACSGTRLDLLAPVSAAIRFGDIAEHLSRLNRWSGAAVYSVAQHSLLVADTMYHAPGRAEGAPYLSESAAAQGAARGGPLAALYGLLHDAHEFAIGDITECALSAIAASVPNVHLAIAGLRGRLDRVIHEALDLDWPPPIETQGLLAACHARVVASEFRDLLTGCSDHAEDYRRRGFPPLTRVIRPYPNAVRAAEEWGAYLTRYAALAGLNRINM